MGFAKFVLAGFGAAALAGCVQDPRNFETTPVTLQTAKGKVTCQLYDPETVLWDRAVTRGPGITSQEADQLCRAEGYRVKKEYLKGIPIKRYHRNANS